MPATYAGVNLSLAKEETALWVERNFPVSDPAWRFRQSVSRRLGWSLPPPLPQVKPGRLYWPRGASRWAVGYFLCTQSQLDAIRKVVYLSQSQPYNAAPLVLDDGTGRVVTTSLYMMPPRQLTPSMNRAAPPSVNDANALYLLELVDDRYRWWFTAANISVDEGTTQWADLYNSIGVALGITIKNDLVNAAYLTPSVLMSGAYEDVPILLDAVAASVGQRIVRQLDGTVEALNPTTSQTRQQAEITATRSVTAGGYRSFGA